MRIRPLAALLASVAAIGLVTNYIGAAAGECDETGCTGSFPEWLYISSGWVVVVALVALVGTALFATGRRLLRRAH